MSPITVASFASSPLKYHPLLVQTQRGPVPVQVSALLACTREQREQGFRLRPEPASDHVGILFVFTHDVQDPFTMKGVLFDLDLIVGDAAGLVTGGCRLRANDETLQYPQAPIRFALEVRAGWASRQGQPVRLILS